MDVEKVLMCLNCINLISSIIGVFLVFNQIIYGFYFLVLSSSFLIIFLVYNKYFILTFQQIIILALFLMSILQT